MRVLLKSAAIFTSYKVGIRATYIAPMSSVRETDKHLNAPTIFPSASKGHEPLPVSLASRALPLSFFATKSA